MSQRKRSCLASEVIMVEKDLIVGLSHDLKMGNLMRHLQLPFGHQKIDHQLLSGPPQPALALQNVQKFSRFAFPLLEQLPPVNVKIQLLIFKKMSSHL